MLEILYSNDVEREAALQLLIVDMQNAIYFGGSALVDSRISQDLADIITDFYLSSNQVARRLCPPPGQLDKLGRAICIINSALKRARRLDSVKKEDFFDRLEQK